MSPLLVNREFEICYIYLLINLILFMKKKDETLDIITGRSLIKKNKPNLKVDESNKLILEFIQSLNKENKNKIKNKK